MKLQDTPSNCGPVSLANAFEALHGRGCALTPAVVSGLIGETAVTGTPPGRMYKAIQKADHVPGKITSMEALLGALALGRVLVALVDDYEHWVAVVGQLGNDRVIVIDSADGGMAQSYTLDEWFNRWTGDDGARLAYSIHARR